MLAFLFLSDLSEEKSSILQSMFTVYALKSINFEKIYIGFTSNIEARLVAHNHPLNKGWTKRFMPWKLIYSENFETKTEAMKREKELKSVKGREFVYNLLK